MKKLIQHWLATTKHTIVADSEDGFRNLLTHTLAELGALDMVIVRVKLRKKKQNGDYLAYNRNYRASIWTMPKEEQD